jgi:hypothetical protein
MTLLRANDIVRKTRKGLVRCHAFDKRSFGVVVKVSKTKVYVIPNKTQAKSIKFIKHQLIIKFDRKDAIIFPMPKLINKYEYISKNE